VQRHVPRDWYSHDGLRATQTRLPKDASTREALARQVGADGDQLLAWVQTADTALGLSDLPALAALRQIWRQPYDRCTAPGLEALRSRTGDEPPPAVVRIAAPDDLEARDSSQRETHGVGSTRHRTETCDADHPDRIAPVMTTPATMHDRVMGPAIHQDLADRDLLPGPRVLDSGDVDADLLVTAQTPHPIEVGGPPCGSYSRQWGKGKAMTCRPSSAIGRPSRRAVPRGMPVSTGGLDTMSQATRSCASGLTGPPVARVPSAERALPPKQPPASSRSAHKSTMRRSRRRGSARGHRRAKPRMRCGQGWRVASRKGSGALISAGVAPWA
jgi:hypothetical protein